ncbi:MAG TPA: 3-hydroxyacyl-CoA dehydrogenase family protein [Spirochaetia bacterium]|nr:3-hydroxyacyl-CoA dehydrogenase family protein [Spirochaetia bacterium]
MQVEGISRICVVGAGTMGHQIALCGALAGYRVVCNDIDEGVMERASRFTDTYLSERVARAKMSEVTAQAARENLSFTTDLEKGAGDADLVIEVIPEVLELKRKLFARLDKICPVHAFLVTNSSFIVSSRLADATARPDKICNMHFFVPPLAMLPVEVVKGPHTSEKTAQTIAGVCTSMGKIPIMLHKEIHGFLVNRILSVVQKEAQFLYDTGVASFEDIDIAVREGLGHKMGPFYQMDLIGLDLVYLIGMEHYRETADPALRPSPAVVEKVARHELGRKTGRGFYDYSDMLKERGY